MDILLIIVGLICLLLGFVGCFAPVLPGPPLSYVSMLLLHFTHRVQFTTTELVVWGVLVILIQVIDFIIPLLGTKYSGGSKWGNWGCAIGMLVGIFILPPWGVIFGPLVGAIVGEMLGGKASGEAMKAGVGAFVGFLLGVIVKVSFCGYLIYEFVAAVIQSS